MIGDIFMNLSENLMKMITQIGVSSLMLTKKGLKLFVNE
jgi:hypothetical protein